MTWHDMIVYWSILNKDYDTSQLRHSISATPTHLRLGFSELVALGWARVLGHLLDGGVGAVGEGAAATTAAGSEGGTSGDKLSVSDSGCVVTVRDTGVASLAVPEHGSRRAAPTAPASPHVTRQLSTWLRILPNCPSLKKKKILLSTT